MLFQSGHVTKRAAERRICFNITLPFQNALHASCTILVISMLTLVMSVTSASGQHWETNADGDIYNVNSGNVGIGKTGPRDALHINHASSPTLRLSDGAGLWAQLGLATVNGMYSSVSTAGDMVLRAPTGGVVLHAGDGAIRFSTLPGPSEKMTISPDGNVGIGTIDPKDKLVVNGNVRANELRLMLDVDAPWPDFVFAADYELMPLTDVEAAIESEGHLPGIPSAQEVSEDGVALGEMQALLLQKIEELTLHMIFLAKENDELRSRLEALEGSN